MVDTRITDKAQAFLNKLRTATGPMHQKLEATSLSRQLLQPGVTRHEYICYLSAMAAVMGWCENHVFPIVSSIINITERKKYPLLKQDLSYLDNSFPIDHNYQCDSVTNSLPMSLGYIYVVEGSTLGGQVILKHIRETLGYTPSEGAAFFAGYGGDTGRRWKEFLNILCTYAVNNNCEEEIIAGSIQAFESIEHYFANSACR